jgi:septation ring formation regulator EzrA
MKVNREIDNEELREIEKILFELEQTENESTKQKYDEDFLKSQQENDYYQLEITQDVCNLKNLVKNEKKCSAKIELILVHFTKMLKSLLNDIEKISKCDVTDVRANSC